MFADECNKQTVEDVIEYYRPASIFKVEQCLKFLASKGLTTAVDANGTVFKEFLIKIRNSLDEETPMSGYLSEFVGAFEFITAVCVNYKFRIDSPDPTIRNYSVEERSNLIRDNLNYPDKNLVTDYANSIMNDEKDDSAHSAYCTKDLKGRKKAEVLSQNPLYAFNKH